MSEPESDLELSATKSKRKASETEFEIPPAKRPEPIEGSVTESESDFDGVIPSRLPASVLTLGPSKGTTTSYCDTGLCSPQLPTGALRGFSPTADSVTESESDDGLPTEVVEVSVTRKLIPRVNECNRNDPDPAWDLYSTWPQIILQMLLC